MPFRPVLNLSCPIWTQLDSITSLSGLLRPPWASPSWVGQALSLFPPLRGYHAPVRPNSRFTNEHHWLPRAFIGPVPSPRDLTSPVPELVKLLGLNPVDWIDVEALCCEPVALFLLPFCIFGLYGLL